MSTSSDLARMRGPAPPAESAVRRGPVGPAVSSETLLPGVDVPGLCQIVLTVSLWPEVAVPLPVVWDPLFVLSLVEMLKMTGAGVVGAPAINLQRDASVMLSNLQILSPFATALHSMSFSMMALGIGQSLFPRAEVDDLSPAPRAARSTSYISTMGLWRPQTGLGDPGPVPVSSCRSCMNCKYCFSEDQLPPG